MTSKKIFRRRAFTLVELLVVVALMGILAGMMSYAMSGARQEAREKRAQAEIAAINAIVLQKMNEINLAPVLFVPPDETSGALSVVANPVVNSGTEANRVSMLGRRDLARMLLPQCRADLIYPPARLQYRKVFNGSFRPCAAKIKEPSEWGTMRRLAGFETPRGVAMEALAGVPAAFSDALVDSIDGAVGYFGTSAGSTSLRNALGRIRRTDGTIAVIDLRSEPWDTDRSADASSPWTRQYESAECLYLILASTELYGERALDQFSARSIANLDGDAVPEIVDPWGVPYEFVRDAPGFGFPFFDATVPISGTPTNQHPAGVDSGDYLRTDLRLQGANVAGENNDTYRMVPLVVSAGPDGEFGIRRTFDLTGVFDDGVPGVSSRSEDGLAGLSPRHSISVIRYTGAGPFIPQPTLAGSYQYPDPYVSFLTTTDTGSASDGSAFILNVADVSARTQNAWFGGLGLGARIHNGGSVIDASGDDIYSIQGDR